MGFMFDSPGLHASSEHNKAFLALNPNQCFTHKLVISHLEIAITLSFVT